MLIMIPKTIKLWNIKVHHDYNIDIKSLFFEIMTFQ